MSNTPLVSIITPVHNDGPYIGKTIDSVLAQTYGVWELIVVDDGSTDNSTQIIKSYNDRRIRYFRNDKSMGAAYARNRAIREAKGEYIAFLDGDDWWAPSKLEHQLDFMQTLKIDFSCTAYYRCLEEASEDPSIITAPYVISRKRMIRCDYIGCLTAMYNAKNIGLIQISNSIKKRNDYAMWLHVSQKAYCYYLDEPLSYYRVRHNSISRISGWRLIRYHKILFRTELHYSWLHSWFCAFRNAFWSVKKKKDYVARPGSSEMSPPVNW